MVPLSRTGPCLWVNTSVPSRTRGTNGRLTKNTRMIAPSANTMDLNESKPLDLSAPDLQDAVNILIAHEHALCRGDEDAADELLADLEPHLRRLNREQNEWLRGLSGDLHMLNDEETSVDNPYPAGEYWALMAEAWGRIEDEPDEFLRLLRFKQDRFSPAKVAYARGRAYGILGFLNVGTVFMRLASELDPQQPYYKMALLTLLNLQKRSDELDKELKRILADSASDPELVVLAVALSFQRTVKASADVARAYLGEMRQKLQRVLGRKPLEDFNPSTVFLGIHTLGSIQDSLNRPTKAQELYRQALRINPQDQAVRVSLAMSLLKNNEEEAFQIFSQVASEGTPFEIAYLFAAKYAGEREMFTESAEMAEKVLSITGNPMAAAFAHGILAIIEAEMNGPTDKAREHFAEALRLAPDNANIRSNYTFFHTELNEAGAQPAHAENSVQKHPSNKWLLLDANLIEAYQLGLQTNEDGIKRSLSEESTKLNTATTENLARQSRFARAA